MDISEKGKTHLKKVVYKKVVYFSGLTTKVRFPLDI